MNVIDTNLLNTLGCWYLANFKVIYINLSDQIYEFYTGLGQDRSEDLIEGKSKRSMVVNEYDLLKLVLFDFAETLNMFVEKGSARHIIMQEANSDIITEIFRKGVNNVLNTEQYLEENVDEEEILIQNSQLNPGDTMRSEVGHNPRTQNFLNNIMFVNMSVLESYKLVFILTKNKQISDMILPEVLTADFAELGSTRNLPQTETKAREQIDIIATDESQVFANRKMTEDDPEMVKSILDSELRKKLEEGELDCEDPYKGENPQMENLRFKDLILKFIKICNKFIRSEAVHNVNFKRKLLQTLGHFSKTMQAGVFLGFVDHHD